jgi:hypothetical protein
MGVQISPLAPAYSIPRPLLLIMQAVQAGAEMESAWTCNDPNPLSSNKKSKLLNVYATGTDDVIRQY